MTNETKSEELTFSNLGIASKLEEIIKSLGYTTPTPIQSKAIPLGIEGRDVLGIAQTGTGKTLAFAIPLIQRIADKKGRVLIIVPTRELALQVEETFKKIGTPIGLKTAVLIGGMAMSIQLRALRNSPHVIIGTPGRLNDHITRRTVRLDTVHSVVLDEADLMLDMGFGPQIKTVLDEVPKPHQTMLFSATMPQEIEKLTSNYMVNPARVEIAVSGATPDKITQSVHYVEKDGRQKSLTDELNNHDGSTIVFVRTKHSAKKLCYDLRAMNHRAAEIHSNRTLAQRRAALDGFKAGKHRILVATDIAARGIDVSGIGLVINYDLPENPEDYIHRIGRTGRAGQKGHAISYATKGQRQLVRRIEKLLNCTIPAKGEPKGYDGERSSYGNQSGRSNRDRAYRSKQSAPSGYNRFPKRRSAGR